MPDKRTPGQHKRLTSALARRKGRIEEDGSFYVGDETKAWDPEDQKVRKLVRSTMRKRRA